MKAIVYLSGPMSGLTHEKASTWRDQATQLLGPDIECLNPMRWMHDFRDSSLDGATYADHGTARNVIMRDYSDVRRSDLLLVNFEDVPTISIGTIGEMMWAWEARKPTVVVSWSTHVYQRHPFIQEATDFRFPDLVSATDCVRRLLLGE